MLASAARPTPDPSRALRGSALAALVVGTFGLVLVSTLLLLGGGLLRTPVEIPFRTTLQILLHQLSGGTLFRNPCAGSSATPAQCSTRVFIVWQLYLPEVLLALIAGASLGISGSALQGIFRNPLADPYLLGISSGGTLGAAIVYVYRIHPGNLDVVLPAFAFLGAAATGLAILAVASGRASSVETLLLSGVAIAYLLSGVLSLVLLRNPFGAEQVTFWLLGGFGLASWQIDAVAFGCVLALGTPLALLGRELNLMQLGPDVATSAGVDARRVRLSVLLLASLVTAVAVAFTGVIGFVGLVSPHVVRRLVGTDYRLVVPGSAAFGAIFLVTANDAANLVFPSTVLPVGIFTAFAGVPFFLLLLFRQRRSELMGGR
ncbi:MAG TPA: iron ABC transporter permease [Thermoplasmata archaeon]|nr:iron ABC transporter permease [Thermoplasmata archaeon]